MKVPTSRVCTAVVGSLLTRLVQFVPNRDFDSIASTLNFSTPDLQVLGGCDLYITKAAGGDKKLYKNIENGLEARHQSDLLFCKSLSPPQVDLAAPTLNLSRSSPFGNLGQVSSRRTYAYLIATLNASHPDYDFSHALRPADFKRERDLRSVMNNIDTTLYSLRPRPGMTVPCTGTQPQPAPAAGLIWGPRTWSLVDQQMRLKQCNIYRYAPEDYDPFQEDEEGAMWSLNYLFFNRALKRVCYLYLRGISVLSQQTRQPPRALASSHKRLSEYSSDEIVFSDIGARKRARYWLGDRADTRATSAVESRSEDENESEHEKLHTGEFGFAGINNRFDEAARPLVDENDNYILSDEDVRSERSDSKSIVRGVSEEIADAMEI